MKLLHLLLIVIVLGLAVFYLMGCAPRVMILHEGDSATFDSTGRLIEYKPKPGSEQEKAALRQWWLDFDQRFER